MCKRRHLASEVMRVRCRPYAFKLFVDERLPTQVPTMQETDTSRRRGKPFKALPGGMSGQVAKRFPGIFELGILFIAKLLQVNVWSMTL